MVQRAYSRGSVGSRSMMNSRHKSAHTRHTMNRTIDHDRSRFRLEDNPATDHVIKDRAYKTQS